MYNREAAINIIKRIERQLKQGNTSLLDEIAKENDNKIKLYIERIEHDSKHLFATFFWKNCDTQCDEVLIGRLTGGQKLESNMKEIAWTGIWYVSFMIKNAFSEVSDIEKRFTIASLRYNVRPVVPVSSPQLAGI
jgi:hypothetical protein